MPQFHSLLLLSMAIIAISIEPANAQDPNAQNNGASLLTKCEKLIKTTDGSKSSPGDWIDATYCSGFIHAAFDAEQRIHEAYQFLFPGLSRETINRLGVELNGQTWCRPSAIYDRCQSIECREAALARQLAERPPVAPPEVPQARRQQLFSACRTVLLSIAASIAVGFDACLPKGLSVQTVAMILSKYGREHPEQLTSTEFGFFNDAMAETYPCP